MAQCAALVSPLWPFVAIQMTPHLIPSLPLLAEMYSKGSGTRVMPHFYEDLLLATTCYLHSACQHAMEGASDAALEFVSTIHVSSVTADVHLHQQLSIWWQSLLQQLALGFEFHLRVAP